MCDMVIWYDTIQFYAILYHDQCIHVIQCFMILLCGATMLKYFDWFHACILYIRLLLIQYHYPISWSHKDNNCHCYYIHIAVPTTTGDLNEWINIDDLNRFDIVSFATAFDASRLFLRGQVMVMRWLYRYLAWWLYR